MATLRELRQQATDLGIAYEKTTNAAELQDMILTKMCEAEIGSVDISTPAPAATPAPVTPPAPAATPVARTPVTPTPASASATPAPTPASPTSASPTSTTDKHLDFKSSIEINEGDLNTEFKQQASLYAYFATAEATAKSNVMAAKLRLEVVDAELTKKIRAELSEGAAKAPTEKAIQSEVILSEQYQAAQKYLIDASKNADIAKGVKEAFGQRKDMLIQLGSAKRQEVDQIGMNLREKAKAVMAA